MQVNEAEALINKIYTAVLARKPQEGEFRYWVGEAVKGRSATELLGIFENSAEFKSRRLNLLQVAPGHFFSPIVDPATVKQYYFKERSRPLSDLSNVQIDLEGMRALLRAWHDTLVSTRFINKGEGEARYFLNNRSFPYGDAAILRATIAHLKPKKIIEIGSGNSTCCMLDTVDEMRLNTKITCIEPYPQYILDKLIGDKDKARLELIVSPVQDVPLEQFKTLRKGDILFIDSTHVMKTGSDVHYELFHILPCLASGVIIHVHDVPYPFEYPQNWIFEQNWSWNEAYALHAFLMYNKAFKVRFWLSLMQKLALPEVAGISTELSQKSGSGVWLEKL